MASNLSETAPSNKMNDNGNGGDDDDNTSEITKKEDVTEESSVISGRSNIHDNKATVDMTTSSSSSGGDGGGGGADDDDDEYEMSDRLKSLIMGRPSNCTAQDFMDATGKIMHPPHHRSHRTSTSSSSRSSNRRSTGSSSLPSSNHSPISTTSSAGTSTGDRRTRMKSAGNRTSFVDRRAAGRVSVSEMNYGVPAVAHVEDHVDEVHGEGSWRSKVIHFIHQKWIQRTMLVLLLLDVLIIFTELFLMTAYPVCQIIVRDCIACCPDGSGVDSSSSESAVDTASAESSSHHSVLRFLSGGGGSGHDDEFCDAGFIEDIGHPSCDSHKWHAVHTLEEVLFWFTITILSLFFLENLAEMIALTPCVYFRQFFMALDFFIITISLVLELVFHLTHKLVLDELAGLLVFIRVWRFVRIGHGLVEITAELEHEAYEELCEYTRELEKKMFENKIPLPDQSDDVKELVQNDKMERLLKEAEALDTIGE